MRSLRDVRDSEASMCRQESGERNLQALKRLHQRLPDPAQALLPKLQVQEAEIMRARRTAAIIPQVPAAEEREERAILRRKISIARSNRGMILI